MLDFFVQKTNFNLLILHKCHKNMKHIKLKFFSDNSLKWISFLVSSLSIQTPGILKYSRFGLTLVKLHISRCKILNGDRSLHSECNARCVMFLSDMPPYVSQSLPLCEYRGLFIGQHSLQFTFHNPSQLYTALIYVYLYTKSSNHNFAVAVISQILSRKIQFVLIMLLFVTNMT